MSVSSRSSSRSRSDYKHIFDELREHMFSSENINRWTRNLTDDQVIAKPVRKIKKKTSTQPKKRDETDIWRARSRDKLLWTFYVICNGRGEFDKQRDRMFKMETDFKYGSVERVRANLTALKAAKVKVQELEAEIVSAKTMSLETMRALSIAYKKSIIFKHDCVYHDMPYGDEYFLIEKNGDDVALHLGDVSEKVSNIKQECFYVDPFKKIKGISAYTVKDLREIAGKLSISLTTDDKPLNKQQLYANIITKITKLT